MILGLLFRLSAILLLLLAGTAHAYQILPKVSDVDRKISGRADRVLWESGGQWLLTNAVPMLKGPVHEAITLRALGCEEEAGNEMACVTEANVLEHRVVLYGVRWPDDPPFRLNPSVANTVDKCDVRVTVRSTAQPDCWRTLFEDAGRRAKRRTALAPAFGPGTNMLYRSHYGDLQFLHAMGAFDGELASSTRQKMRMWAEYLWRIAVGDLPADVYIRDLPIAGLGELFPGDMTSTNLLATGIVAVRRRLPEVALGALLHMVQDSFSRAHVTRNDASGGMCSLMPSIEAPGRIVKFHSYARQDSAEHDVHDTSESLALRTMQEAPSVVDVSAEFVRLWRQRATWSEASKYFDCVFELVDERSPAGPGPYVRS